MFGYIFRTGTYYLIWKRFKKELIAFIVSVILIVMIFSIFNDLFVVLKITDLKDVAWLLFLKWSLVLSIIGFNIYFIRKLSTKKVLNEDSENKKDLQYHHNILEKKKLKTKTDVILQKYLDKNNV